LATAWVTKRYSEGDEKLILELRREIRGWTYTEDYWRWRCVDNPAGPAIVWLAMADGRAVGHSAILPRTLKVGDAVIRAGLSVDAWTHPGFRRQGMFTALHKKALDDAADRGIELVFSFPNDLSYPGFLKLGYSHLFSVPRRRKVVNWGSVIGARTKMPLAGKTVALLSRMRNPLVEAPIISGIEVNEVTSFDERFDTLWSRAAEHFPATVVRDSTYLNWRYARNPHYDYATYVAERQGRLLGYVVLNSLTSDLVRGYIVDLQVAPYERDVYRNLIAKSDEYFRKQNVDTIHCWMLGSEVYREELGRAGFRRRSTPVRFCAQSLGGTTPDLVEHPHNWWLCPGDYDL